MAIEIEQIKGIQNRIVSSARCAASTKCLLQHPEIRCAILPKHDSFAIKNKCRWAKSFRGFLNRGKIACPIVASARDDANAVAFGVDSQSIAIPFYFVSPVTSIRHLCGKCCQLRFNARGHRIKGQLRLTFVVRLGRLALEWCIEIRKKSDCLQFSRRTFCHPVRT